MDKLILVCKPTNKPMLYVDKNILYRAYGEERANKILDNTDKFYAVIQKIPK